MKNINYQTYTRGMSQDKFGIMYSTDNGVTIAFLLDIRSDELAKFQQWVKDNQDNLPDDIQEKVDSGVITIEPADEVEE